MASNPWLGPRTPSHMAHRRAGGLPRGPLLFCWAADCSSVTGQHTLFCGRPHGSVCSHQLNSIRGVPRRSPASSIAWERSCGPAMGGRPAWLELALLHSKRPIVRCDGVPTLLLSRLLVRLKGFSHSDRTGQQACGGADAIPGRCSYSCAMSRSVSHDDMPCGCGASPVRVVGLHIPYGALAGREEPSAPRRI